MGAVNVSSANAVVNQKYAHISSRVQSEDPEFNATRSLGKTFALIPPLGCQRGGAVQKCTVAAVLALPDAPGVARAHTLRPGDPAPWGRAIERPPGYIVPPP